MTSCQNEDAEHPTWYCSKTAKTTKGADSALGCKISRDQGVPIAFFPLRLTSQPYRCPRGSLGGPQSSLPALRCREYIWALLRSSWMFSAAFCVCLRPSFEHMRSNNSFPAAPPLFPASACSRIHIKPLLHDALCAWLMYAHTEFVGLVECKYNISCWHNQHARGARL